MIPRHYPDESSTVTIVVPAKDEEAGIGETLRSLPIETLERMDLDPTVVVLDGDSDDETPRIAREWGATVVKGPGTGKAAGFKAARDRFEGDFVVMLDGDGTYAGDAIPRLVSPLVRDEADVVAGDRDVQPGAMKTTHRLGNALLSAQASLLYGRLCPDLCTGMWAFRRRVLEALPLESRGFELEAELFALASRLDLTVERVKVDYLPREGETNMRGRRHGWRISWWLLRSRVAPLPDRGRSRGPAPEAVGEGV